MGNVEIGELTSKSAAYTARYIMKKFSGPSADLHYLDTTTGEILQPPYTTMSTRPGIGRSWIDKYHKEVFPLDEVIVDGHQARPPKYYDAQYERIDPEGYAELKKKREANGNKHKADNTPARLAVKAEHLEAKTSTLKRKL